MRSGWKRAAVARYASAYGNGSADNIGTFHVRPVIVFWTLRRYQQEL